MKLSLFSLMAFLCLPTAIRADVLWQAHNPSPKAGNLAQIQIDDQGRMLAIFQTTFRGLAVSLDGTNWVWERTALPEPGISDAAYGNGKWVLTSASTNVQGNTTIQVSTDLHNWTRVEVASGRFLKRLTFGNGKFWLIGEVTSGPAATYTSTDGLTWTLVPGSNLPLFAFNSVSYDETNHLLVAVGNIIGASSTSSALVTSPDGATWTTRLQPTNNGQLYHVRCNNGADVTCGDNATNIYRSTDGITWTPLTVANSPFTYSYVANFKTNWLCHDFSGSYIVSSNNGATWTGSKNTGFSSPFAISYSVFRTNDSRWYGCGGEGALAYTTNFVGNWTNVQTGTHNHFSGGLAQGPNRIVAAGNGGVLYSSPEGTNWQAVVSGTTGDFQGMHYFGNFFLGFTGGRAFKSFDGITFSNFSTTLTIVDAMYDGTKIIGWRNGGGTNFYTTTDGVNWTAITNTVVPGNRDGKLYKFNSTYVYPDSSSSGFICVSSDLNHWTTNFSPFFNGFSFDPVLMNGKIYYGFAGGMLISPNGTNYTSYQLFNQTWNPGDGPLIVVSNRLYTMAGNPNYGRLIYSDDGTNWNPATVSLDFYPGMVTGCKMLYTGSRLVTCGSFGNIASLSAVLDGGTAPGAPQDFTAWKSQFSFPPGQSDPEDDPDSDGIPNLAEFAQGTNPLSAASKTALLSLTTSVSGQAYPAISYVHDTKASGVSITAQAATDAKFTAALATTEVLPRQALSNGLELVTVRLTQPATSVSNAFFRLAFSTP